MRLKLKFLLQNFVIPLDYYRVFLSFLKKSVSDINNGAYFDRYFSGNSRRPYTFSIGLPYPTFEKNSIRLSKNELSMIFSTGDKLTGYVFYSAFLSQKNKSFPLKNNSMKLVSIQNMIRYCNQVTGVIQRQLWDCWNILLFATADTENLTIKF